MRPYPRIPDPPDPHAAEPLAVYGGRLVCYLLQVDCTAAIEDWQLNQAESGLACAIARLPKDGADLQLSKLSRLRHLVADTVRRRQKAQTPPPAALAPRPAANDDDGGQAQTP